MSPASVVREVVIRDWVVDATDAIDLLERLPELLVEVRTLRGISQREAARQIGVSSATACRIEAKVGVPSLEAAVAILRWLTETTRGPR